MVTIAAMMGRMMGRMMTARMIARTTSRRMDRTITARTAAVRTMMIAIVKQQYVHKGIMVGILLLG
jgi:hypothetical protein